jgi:hypothetical protein
LFQGVTKARATINGKWFPFLGNPILSDGAAQVPTLSWIAAAAGLGLAWGAA